MNDTRTRFFCLCMSPAIDATVTLPRAPKGEGEIFKNVAEEGSTSPAGWRSGVRGSRAADFSARTTTGLS